MQSVIKLLIIFFVFILSSCVFGPVKELKYQIEDSFDQSDDVINPEPLKDISNKIEPVLIWKVDTAENKLKNLKINLFEGTLTIPTPAGDIFLIDSNAGKIINIFEEKLKINAGIVRDNENFFFTDSEGFVNSIKIDKTYNWRSFVGEVYAIPLIVTNKIIVKLTDNTFIALNINDGSIIWKYKAPSSLLSIRSWGQMVNDDGVLYSGISSGKILALDVNKGSLIWETSYSEPKGTSEIDRANDTASTPVLSDIFIYVVSTKGDLAALNKTNGDVIWKRPFSSFYDLLSYGNSIISVHNSGSIYSFDKLTNTINWRNTDLSGRVPNISLIFNDILTVTDFEGYVHFFDINDGKNIARLKLGNSFFVDAAINENKQSIIFVNSDGAVSLIDMNIKNAQTQIESDQKNIRNDIEKNQLDKNDTETSIIDNLIFWD